MSRKRSKQHFGTLGTRSRVCSCSRLETRRRRYWELCLQHHRRRRRTAWRLRRHNNNVLLPHKGLRLDPRVGLERLKLARAGHGRGSWCPYDTHRHGAEQVTAHDRCRLRYRTCTACKARDNFHRLRHVIFAPRLWQRKELLRRCFVFPLRKVRDSGGVSLALATAKTFLTLQGCNL